MTKLRDIPTTLETHLNSLADLPQVAWPNAAPFDFDADSLYIRPQISVGRTVAIGSADSDKSFHNGMYQVDIFVPKGSGVGIAVNLAQRIADHFAKGSELETSDGKIRITNAEIESSGTNLGSHYQVALLIAFTTVVSQGA
jgi:hypothetical protein